MQSSPDKHDYFIVTKQQVTTASSPHPMTTSTTSMSVNIDDGAMEDFCAVAVIHVQLSYSHAALTT